VANITWLIIVTSYFGQIRNLLKERLLPVSIAHFTPSWFNGYVYGSLAPDKKMMQLKKVETFLEVYESYVLKRKDQEGVIEKMKSISEGYDGVALCTFEKDPGKSHRKLVMKWLNGWIVENLGSDYRVKEFVPARKISNLQLTLML